MKKQSNYTYENGVTPMMPLTGMYHYNYVRLEDGRYFIDRLNTYIELDYVLSKNCYEIVKYGGKECAINMNSGMIYSTYTEQDKSLTN